MTTRSSNKPLLLLGGGAHAMVVAEAAVASNIPLVGFLDDDADANLRNLAPHLGPLAKLNDASPDANVIIALGDVALRAWVVKRLTRPAAPIVHPSAVVSPTAVLGAGVFVGPLAVIHARARVGDHAIINTAAVIEHDCAIGINTHVAPGSVLGGAATVGPDTLLGLGCRVLPGARVGARSVVGAGSVVLHAVPDNTTVVGVPAHERKRSAF